jgi:nucleoside permease NupC
MNSLPTRVSSPPASGYIPLTLLLYHTELAPMKDQLSERAFTIASYALCGFANLGSLGIQIGVLSALAPARGRVISSLAFSAMICGFVRLSHLIFLS